MSSMLLAELAILAHLDTVRIVFLVFKRCIVALLALCACHCNLYSHASHTSIAKSARTIILFLRAVVNNFFNCFSIFDILLK